MKWLPLFFLLFSPLFSDPIILFSPPENWECVKPKNLPESIEIAFLKNGVLNFRPSLNLSKEKISLSLKEYLHSVKKLHESELNAEWRDLGDFFCRGGKGRLAEIRADSPAGELRMLQAIFVQEDRAYILTGAARKEEFPKERASFLKAMRSLGELPDLFSAIPDKTKREALKEHYDSLTLCADDEERSLQWRTLPSVLAEHEELGNYWLFLALKEGLKRIYSEGDS